MIAKRRHASLFTHLRHSPQGIASMGLKIMHRALIDGKGMPGLNRAGLGVGLGLGPYAVPVQGRIRKGRGRPFLRMPALDRSRTGIAVGIKGRGKISTFRRGLPLRAHRMGGMPAAIGRLAKGRRVLVHRIPPVISQGLRQFIGRLMRMGLRRIGLGLGQIGVGISVGLWCRSIGGLMLTTIFCAIGSRAISGLIGRRMGLARGLCRMAKAIVCGIMPGNGFMHLKRTARRGLHRRGVIMAIAMRGRRAIDRL